MLKMLPALALSFILLLGCKSSQKTVTAATKNPNERTVIDYGVNDDANARPDASDTGINFVSGDFDNFMADAKKGGKPHWVYFYADWCKPCKRMSAYTFSDERVKNLSNNTFLAFKIDVDKFEGMDIAERYQLTEYPVMLLFNAKGELVEKLAGFYAPDSFLEKLNTAL